MSDGKTLLQLGSPLRRLLLVATAVIVAGRLLAPLVPETVGRVLFGAVTVGLLVYAGWTVTRHGALASAAALAAIAVLVVQVVLGFGAMLVYHAASGPDVGMPYGLALQGIVMSTLLFSPLAAALGWCGHFLARRPRSSA
jgi:hypothetical protein